MSWQKIINILLLLFLFLLPWQTRLIYEPGYLTGLYNEYTTLSLYGTEILSWVIIIFFGINFFWEKKIARAVLSPAYWRAHPGRLGGVLLMLFLFAVWGVGGHMATGQFLTRLLGALCLITVFYNSRLPFHQAVGALWLGGVGQGILALQQFFAQKIIGNKWLGWATQNPADAGVSVVQSADERWLRAYGSFGSPNALGIYLAVVFIIGLIIYFYHRPSASLGGRGKWLGWGLLTGQAIIFSGIILSFSRSAWLGVLGGGIMFIWLGLKSQSVRKKFLENLSRLAMVCGLLALLFFITLRPLFFTRLSGRGYLERLSVTERQTQFTEARDIFFRYPWRGAGAGIYTVALAEIVDRPRFGFFEPVHNIYFLILAELGLLGFSGWLYLVATAIKKIAVNNLVYLPAIFTLCLTGIFDHWLWSMFTGLIFWWVILGVGFLSARKDSPV